VSSIVNEGWFSIPVGLLGGTVVSYVFFVKSRIRVSLASSTSDATIVAPEEDSEKLEMRYDGEAVPRVTRSVVGIWNNGTQAIRRDDLSGRDRFRIEAADGVRILRSAVLQCTRDAIDATILRLDGQCIHLDFDFLNPGDGLSVEVIHTGVAGAVRAAGAVKGMAREIGAPKSPSRALRAIAFAMVTVLCLTVVLASLAMLGGFLFLAYRTRFPGNVIIAACTVLLAYLAVSGIKAGDDRGRYRIRGAPKVISDSLISNIRWLRSR
jgi:hypothetical protein